MKTKEGICNVKFTNFWGSLQSLKSLVQKHLLCRNVDLSSEFSRVGDLIEATMRRWTHRYEAGMKKLFLRKKMFVKEINLG